MNHTPSFESQEIVSINKNKKVRRDLLSLRHYQFKQKLLTRSKGVVICKEHYTSKTCGSCGYLNNVGSSKIYNCKICNLTIDRDINGARNILLKNLI